VPLPAAGDIALVVAGALAAGFVNGLSGMGYALVALGFWLQAMPPATAAPLVALCSVAGHLQSLPRIMAGVRWPRLWPFLVGGAVGVPLGILLLDRIDPPPLKLAVGVLLLLYSGWMAFVRRPPIVTGGGRAADGAIGFIGGLLGGMASLSGPAPAIWAQLRGYGRNEQRGINQPFNMVILSLALISAAIAGFLDRRFLFWAAVGIPSTLIGARLGLVLYGRISDVGFRYVILALLALSGISLIATSL
jgi:uncharacterized protein